GRYQEAIRDYSKALQLDNHQSEIYLNRAVDYMKTGFVDEARRDLDEAILLNRSLSQAYESRGLLALGEGDTQLAIQDFTTAIRLGADGGLVHYNRAVALSMTGDLV
ncbi:MAG: tetratricopeptide repeat protein, partial [Nitrospira sp.]|nr:tetratricopeptide repeat protein [Nitrospira sp.]